MSKPITIGRAFEAMTKRAETAEREVERLRAALKPFAKVAESISKAHLDGHTHDDDMIYVRYGDLCEARRLTEDTTALAEPKEGGDA